MLGGTRRGVGHEHVRGRHDEGLTASVAKCCKNREIEAFRVESGRDGSLGKTKTNKRGKWCLRGEVPGSTSNGVYYAKVSETGAASSSARATARTRSSSTPTLSDGGRLGGVEAAQNLDRLPA